MLIVGADNISVAQHIYNAQLGRGSNSIGGSLMLTCKLAARTSKDKDRKWYNKKPECNSYVRARAVIKYNTASIDCDEYPMFATYQGGSYNYPIRTSLRPQPSSENRSVGALSARLYRSFKYKNRKRFIVVASAGIPYSAWVPEK